MTGDPFENGNDNPITYTSQETKRWKELFRLIHISLDLFSKQNDLTVA